MSPRFRAPFVVVAALAASLAVSCDSVDLSKALQVQPVLTGYYDDGLLNGENHLIPSITFKIKNVDNANTISSGLPVTVSFWFAKDADGENDSVMLNGLVQALAPGAETAAITARAPHGFTLAGARADFFKHSGFKDMTVKVFVQRHGKFFQLGEFPIDRVIIPHVYTTPGRP
jgi:hypothetical protein